MPRKLPDGTIVLEDEDIDELEDLSLMDMLHEITITLDEGDEPEAEDGDGDRIGSSSAGPAGNE